jgi:pyrroline-5-carboxylate reductase
MLKGKKIAFVGGGVMAEAIFRNLLQKKVLQEPQIAVAEPREDRIIELRERYGITVQSSNEAVVANAEIVILAVKPQTLPAVVAELHSKIPPKALVISILAGAKMSAIANGLAHASVIRAMPNMPAQIGEGITAWAAAPNVIDDHKEQAREILAALGVEVFVKDEDALDMATALSGSGPGYVFLFMESLVDAGVHLGFPRELARQFVLQTVKGSAEYALQSPASLGQLREQVTSPGGTTAEALYYLEKTGFRATISRAVWAAYQRAQQLGRGKKQLDQDND